MRQLIGTFLTVGAVLSTQGPSQRQNQLDRNFWDGRQRNELVIEHTLTQAGWLITVNKEQTAAKNADRRPGTTLE